MFFTSPKRIIVEFVNFADPAPKRSWCAYYQGEVDPHNFSWGESAEKAVYNLNEKLKETQDTDSFDNNFDIT